MNCLLSTQTVKVSILKTPHSHSPHPLLLVGVVRGWLRRGNKNTVLSNSQSIKCMLKIEGINPLGGLTIPKSPSSSNRLLDLILRSLFSSLCFFPRPYLLTYPASDLFWKLIRLAVNSSYQMTSTPKLKISKQPLSQPFAFWGRGWENVNNLHAYGFNKTEWNCESSSLFGINRLKGVRTMRSLTYHSTYKEKVNVFLIFSTIWDFGFSILYFLSPTQPSYIKLNPAMWKMPAFISWHVSQKIDWTTVDLTRQTFTASQQFCHKDWVWKSMDSGSTKLNWTGREIQIPCKKRLKFLCPWKPV